MQLVEEPGISRQMSFQEAAEILVACLRRNEAMASEHAPAIGVGHEDRPAGAVEEDGIRRLGADPWQSEQLPPEPGQRCPLEGRHAPAVAGQQPGREVAQPARLQAVGPGGADQSLKPRRGQRGQPGGSERASRPQVGDGALHSGPGGMLGQDGAHGDLEGAPGRPPPLRPESREERHVQAEEAALDRIPRRLQHAHGGLPSRVRLPAVTEEIA